MKKLIFFLLIAGVITGCSTIIPEPTKNGTLLIGQILYNAKGSILTTYRLNIGEHKSGIRFTFQNLKTNMLFYLNTDDNGIFASAGLPAGDYIILDVVIIVADSSGSSSSGISPARSPDKEKFFTIVEGKVNNLGFINWDEVLDESLSISMNKEYDKVQNFFKAKYSSSGWLEKEWVPVNVRKTNDKEKIKTPEL